ncbi:hypothetical protein ACH5RR_001301 [Cinchona calisaya]|uniref:Retroviral polymerase SH3-like domain-containing protein n=1 Tax=Cinchona calisaya TaxID=153742 RepID=A0ABD3B3K5_9GENT
MISECDLPKYFWVEAVYTTCYVINRVLVRPFLNKTPYELLYCKKSVVSYFKIFCCKYFILKIKENLRKFDKKSNEEIFLGYFSDKKAYRVYNRRTLLIEEVVHVTFDETNDIISKNVCEDENVGIKKEFEKLTIHEEHQGISPNNVDNTNHLGEEGEKDENTPKDLPKAWRFVCSHRQDLIIGDPSMITLVN